MQPNYTAENKYASEISAYEGSAAVTNDRGELVFFTNGRKAWRADGTLITDSILAGNECGHALGNASSAAHGVMILRHPLQPLYYYYYYYVVTADDIVNQVCGINGVTVAIIDSLGNLVKKSLPIDDYVKEGRDPYRTTESIAATTHHNGVDIWLTFQSISSGDYLTYLLSEEGFVHHPIVSYGMSDSLGFNDARGDMDFSHDGTKFASGYESVRNEYGTINLCDFDDKTGVISNRKKVYHSQWFTQNVINLIFLADDSEIHFEGTVSSGIMEVKGD